MAKARPTSSCLIAMTQRSGSTMLCRALADTGIAGRAEEYLLDGEPSSFPPGWSFWERGIFATPGMTREEYLAHVYDLGTTSNGVFAVKLAWNNVPFVLRRLGQMPEFEGLDRGDTFRQLLPGPRIVRLVRRDRVAQAVSWARAAQDGVWVVSNDEPARPTGEPEYNFELITNLMRLIVEGERGWGSLCDELGLEPLTVVYEDLAEPDTYASVVRSVLDHLGLDAADATVRSPRTVQQADAVNREWCDRYRTEAADRNGS